MPGFGGDDFGLDPLDGLFDPQEDEGEDLDAEGEQELAATDPDGGDAGDTAPDDEDPVHGPDERPTPRQEPDGERDAGPRQRRERPRRRRRGARVVVKQMPERLSRKFGNAVSIIVTAANGSQVIFERGR